MPAPVISAVLPMNESICVRMEDAVSGSKLSNTMPINCSRTPAKTGKAENMANAMAHMGTMASSDV